MEILEQDGYLSVAAGRFKGYQVSCHASVNMNPALQVLGILGQKSLRGEMLSYCWLCLLEVEA